MRRTAPSRHGGLIMINAVFLPSNPETTLFDAVESVERAVRHGCRLYVRKADGRMAFIDRSLPGWIPFGLHRAAEAKPQ